MYLEIKKFVSLTLFTEVEYMDNPMKNYISFHIHIQENSVFISTNSATMEQTKCQSIVYKSIVYTFILFRQENHK